MKVIRSLALLLASLLLLSACSFWQEPGEETFTKADSLESTPSSETTGTEESGSESSTGFPIVDPPEERYSIIEDLSHIFGVVAVEGISDFSMNGYKACQMLYETPYESTTGQQTLQIAADIILPDDYEDNDYPILLYFADRTTKADYVPSVNKLCETFCPQNAIVIRIYARGQGNSKGASKAWGGDFADVTNLLNILNNSLFLKHLPVYAVGSGIGSIAALRLAAEDTGNRVRGCAVTNPIADLKAYINSADEDAAAYMMQLIRQASYDKKPEEYHLRSAVSFADEIRVPLLIIGSTAAADPYPVQTGLLTAKLTELGKTYQEVTVPSDTSNFFGEDVVKALFDWLRTL